MIATTFRLMRFLVSGTIGAATNIFVLYVCTDVWGVWYIYSGIAAFIISTAVSFAMQKLWTFKNRSSEKLKRQAALYLSLAAFNLCINTFLLYVFTDIFHIYYLLSQVFASIIIAFGSYFAYAKLFKGVPVVMEKNSKTKVLFAINCMNVGGAPMVALEQMKHLPKDRFEVSILTLYKSKKANFLNELSFIPKERQFHLNLWRRSPLDIITFFKIVRILHKGHFDAVYTHLFLANLLVRLAAIIAGTPVILCFEHSTYWNKSSWQVWMDRILAKRTSKIIVSTNAVKEFTSKQERIPASKFEVIRNPITLPEVSEGEAAMLRSKLGIPQNTTVVLTVGRFSEEKGQEFLVDAAKILIAKSELFFVIVGHGSRRDFLIQRVKECNISNKVFVLEDPQNAKRYYGIADIFVLPSLREGQSLVMSEAMQSNIPVVATNIEGIRESVEDGKTALLAKPGDGESLASKIEELLNNPELRQKLVANAEASLPDLTPEANALKIANILAQK